MEPLARKKRIFYFILFSIIFFILVPISIFYAKGYRPNLSDLFKTYLSGGLYISVSESGASIYVNNNLEGKTNIVQKSILVKNLRPGIYEIRVEKDEKQSWTKTLKVYPEIVTEAHPYLVKKVPVLTEIPKFLEDQNGVATTSSAKSVKVTKTPNPEYKSLLAVFNTKVIKSATSTKATSTPADIKEVRKILVENINGRAHISWQGEEDAIPYYFCQNGECQNKIILVAKSSIIYYDFFPGRDDLLILRLSDGIYIAEIDNRSAPNIVNIISGADYEFRVINSSEIYVKNGEQIFLLGI